MKFVFGVSGLLAAAGAFWFFWGAPQKPDDPTENAVSSSVPSITDSALETKASLHSAAVNRALPAGFSKQSARAELQTILLMSVEIDREAALVKLYQKWMQLDAYDALAHVHQLKDKSIHDLLYTIALSVWARDNSIAFDAWLKDENPDERYVSALVAVVIDEQTPEELAIDWVDFVADLVASEEARQKIMDRWVAKDPRGIVTWGLTTVKGRTLLEEIFQAMTRDNAENSFTSLALLEDEKQSLIISALGAIRSFLTVEALDQDVMFAIQLLPQKVRSLTLQMMMPFIAQAEDPGLIGAMIEGLPDNYTRTVMLESMTYIWAKRDPEGAAQFALTLPKSDRQAQAVAGAVAQWHMQDLPAASEWLNSVRGDNVSTDKAAHHLASHAADDPEYVDIAKAWVERIEDPEIKKKTTQDVAANWIIHDEEKAADFLRAQGIFSPEKAEWFIQDQLENKRLNQELEEKHNQR